jgi:hypothetical protein
MLGGGQHAIPSKTCFNEHLCMTGILVCQVYACHIFHLDASESASADRRFRACRVKRAVSDLDFLRILSVLATERPPGRGWGLPKIHNQVLIPWTLPLQLHASGPAGSPRCTGTFQTWTLPQNGRVLYHTLTRKSVGQALEYPGNRLMG